MDGLQYIKLQKLEEKHKITFLNESQALSKKILDCLYELKEDPKNKEQIQRLVQSADILVGAAKFLQDKNLEQHAKLILKTFSDANDVSKNIIEITRMIDYFQMMQNNKLGNLEQFSK